MPTSQKPKKLTDVDVSKLETQLSTMASAGRAGGPDAKARKEMNRHNTRADMAQETSRSMGDQMSAMKRRNKKKDKK